MTGIYTITLRAPSGEERTVLAWLPTEQVRQDYHNKAAKRGLEIVNEKEI